MGVFTTIGTWLGASSATAFATGATAVTAAAAATTVGVTGAQQASQAKKAAASQQEQMAALSQQAKKIPTDASDIAREAALKKRKALARSKSVYTSPLGLEGEAETARKTLLGR
jgi:uncharacterized protein (DUF58 family)